MPTFESEQFIAQPIEKVFNFFSDEKNLELLTPPFLGFQVTYKSTPKIEKGTEIRYRLKIHGIPCQWITQIDEWEEGRYFIDRQVKGPYSLWVHRHSFESVEGGTLMRDHVQYRLPMGEIGQWVVGRWVRKDIEKVFQYRTDQIKKIFG